MNKKAFAFLTILSMVISSISCLGKVKVKGTNFIVDDEIIFMNGVNTPWDKWNDFGGDYNESFWDSHFKKLHENGINSSRVWVSCNGLHVKIDTSGKVKGPTDKYWTDLDAFFAMAEKNGIYIMATLMSFDNFKDEGQPYMSWRALLSNEKNMDSYVETYVIPFVKRFSKYPSLWSIDLCNEPDWIHENDQCGQLDWEPISKLFAKCAAAIHENSDVLVTIGFGMIKYNSKKYEGNFGADDYLKKLADNPKAYLDFYSPHFYEWEAEWFGFPFDTDPISFGLDGTKPAVIGEFPATGMTSNTKGSKKMDGNECYVNTYKSGWNGIMAWTSNGVDTCGKLDDFVKGVNDVAKLMKSK
jgi:hypothetical protein